MATKKKPTTGMTIPEHDGGALVQRTPPSWLSHIMQQMDEAAPEAPSNDPAAYFQAFLRHMQKGAAHAALAGWNLAQAHDLGGRPFIVDEARRIGAHPSTLYNYKGVYEVLEQAAQAGGGALVNALLQIDQTKLLVLRRLPAPEFASLVEGEEVHGITLDALPSLSYRDLQERIRDAERSDARKEFEEELNRTKHLLEQSEMELLDLRRQQSTQREPSPWPSIVAEVRMESAALAEQALLAIDELHRLLERWIQQQPDSDAEYRGGAGALWAQLRAVTARANRVMGEAAERLEPDVVEGDDTILIPFSNAEVVQAMTTREVLLSQHRAQSAARADIRAGAEPVRRGRGRPRKGVGRG